MISNQIKVVQLYDDPNSDPAGARYICFEQPILHAAQFVIIECSQSNRSYLGRISGAQLNFNRNALSPTDNIAINQLEEISFGRMNRDVAVKEVFYYEITLLKEIANGSAESVRVRPQIGALARTATDIELIKLLALPAIDPKTEIGVIVDTSIPICISKETLVYHTLIAGSTGSGKTNGIANIICGAMKLGFAVVVFDHKPDYQNTHETNNENKHISEALFDTEYWYIGRPLSMPNRSELKIKVAASELDKAMLANTIFHLEGEENQAESCEQLMYFYANEKEDQGETWTLRGFINKLLQTDAKKAPGNQNPTTYRSIVNKITRPARIPDWIDAQPDNLLKDKFFKAATLIRPGKATVVRVGSQAGDGREYGLLLSHILDGIYENAEVQKICPVLVVIDESQDIWSASRQFKQVASEMLNRNIRKGRSKRIAYLIGVQSADAVPESIINNLNNRIILRHNSFEQVRIAASMATEDQRKMTSTFGAGEALISMYGSNSIVHAKLRRSPFRLTKEEL